jgi:hypothetical protein
VNTAVKGFILPLRRRGMEGDSDRFKSPLAPLFQRGVLHCAKQRRNKKCLRRKISRRTQLTVATDEGTKFPSSGKFRAVLWAVAYTNPSDDPNAEVVEAELNSGDIFDITRGKEGTSGQAWSSGDNFAHTITAETIEEVGKVIQTVHSQTGALATGTTTIPYDDTIPQNNEGDEYMTLSITPESSTNKLVIEVLCVLSSSAGQNAMTVALFQDSTADALAVTAASISNANEIQTIRLTHEMTAGTTSSTTFKVRAGGDIAATTTFNGRAGAGKFGGKMASSIRITEYKA